MLELGCGTGLVGITLLKTLGVRSHLFTDCHFRVLNAVVNNLKINFPPSDENDQEEAYKKRLGQLETGPPQKISEEMVERTSYHHKIPPNEEEEEEEEREATVRHLNWATFGAEDADTYQGKFDVILVYFYH